MREKIANLHQKEPKSATGGLEKDMICPAFQEKEAGSVGPGLSKDRRQLALRRAARGNGLAVN